MHVQYFTRTYRQRNPERLNLDRRNLEVCPLLEQEEKLRLLNYQNNNIKSISNLENLPQLIFLDFYNNHLQSLEGPLSSVKGVFFTMTKSCYFFNMFHFSCSLSVIYVLCIMFYVLFLTFFFALCFPFRIKCLIFHILHQLLYVLSFTNHPLHF